MCGSGEHSPSPCVVHGGCSSHHCTKPVRPWALPWCKSCSSAGRPAPESFSGQEAKNPSRLYALKKLIERAQFLKGNKALNCLTLSAGEKRLDLLFSPGVCTQEDTQDTIPDVGWVIRGPGTYLKCLPRPDEDREKSHKEIVVVYVSPSLFYKQTKKYQI